MKKCDIKGCKEKATIFLKTVSFCEEHYKQIFPETSKLFLKR